MPGYSHSIRTPSRTTILPRLAAGAMGGLVGGLAFAALLYVTAILETDIAGRGVLPFLQMVLGTEASGAIYSAHLVMSVVFGLLFALIVSPRHRRASLGIGLLYGALVWLFAGFLTMRLLTGAPLAFDFEAAYNLAGHLLYGLTLGAIYAWFARLEVYEAMHSENARVREWGRQLERP